MLSALEGIAIASPALTDHTMPIGMVILILLFLVQRFGTCLVRRMFGPMIFLLFLSLSVTGLQQILLQPAILATLNPACAVAFLGSQSAQCELLSVLGSAVLGRVPVRGPGPSASLGTWGRCQSDCRGAW